LAETNKPNDNRGESRKAFPHHVTILGIGNELMSDEGIGVFAAKELQALELPAGVDVVEGGTDGFGLINIITDTDYLIVIDSLKGGGEPGTIYKFDVKEAPSCPGIFKTSIHQVGILEVLNLSELIGNTPETIVFGVEPKTISMGMTISPELKNKVPRLLELVMAEVDRIQASTQATRLQDCTVKKIQ
jgi:hydrogenase maturation protease